MKKSFKKAGAAVLSMSMLLAMGAVSMPVYAADPTNWPGQVEVVIDSNSTWANDTGINASGDNRTFDYLKDVTSATVNMYRVATLGATGWQWETGFREALTGYYTPDGATTQLNSFEKLLTVYKDANDVEHFTATSEEMLQVASALERAARDGNLTPLASDTAPISEGSGSILLPGDSELNAKTKDIIGYYLITTTTDDAGVVLQPVLITLKNSDSGENPVEVALKGYEIDVEKKITKVEDKDKQTALGGTVISTTGDTAVVAKDDIITYTITTEIPKYDVNLATTNMKPFTITDTPDDGIAVTEASGSSGTQTYAPMNLVVVADNGTSGSTETGDDVTLVLNTDYTVTATATGFTINIPANVYHTNSNTTGKKLEGQVITATFEATVKDETFNTENYANAGYSDLTAEQINATSTKAGEVTAANATWTASQAGENQPTGTDLANVKDLLGITDGDLTDVQKAQVYLAYVANSNSWNGLTADMINGKLEAATALKEANTTYTTATAMSTEDQATVLATINNATDPAGTDTELTDAKKVQAYLALQELKATPAGEKNTATIGYGNQYATGLGDGNDEDDVTVYSVDLDLTKVTETLKLNQTENYGDDDHDKWYDADNQEEYVSGAVFDLIKEDDAHSETADKKPKSLGLAVSDVNGKLWLLTAGTAQAEKPVIATTIETGAIAYFVDNGDNTYTPYTVSDTSVETNEAWRKVTQGTYTLKELHAPAGYKTISDMTITVNPAKTGTEYNGSYAATTSDTEAKAVKSETGGGSLDYVGVDGALEARIVDPKADTLPATGGIGTVLFTAGGISIVLIAGALFVMYMKKRNAEDEE